MNFYGKQISDQHTLAGRLIPVLEGFLLAIAKACGQADKLNGLFVRGIVMSSVAKALKRKDGTGVFVIARHELALQPGLALWEAFHDPKDGKVKLDGENVIEFPKLPDFQQVTLKVLRWEEKDKRFVIKDAELVSN
jgi:hypothetical protein